MSLVEEARLRAPSIHELAGIEAGKKTGPCPLHDDRSPSFSIFDDGQRWRCHTCNIGGDALDLMARLEGREVGKIIRTLASGEAPLRAPIARPKKPATAPTIDPEKQRAVMALWIKARARIEDTDSQAARALAKDRITASIAEAAILRQLVGDTDGLKWAGFNAGYPYSLVIPLMAIPDPGQEQDERPVDLARRRVTPTPKGGHKILSLKDAAPKIPKAFGSVPHALQGRSFTVVEGATNWVALTCRDEPCIGLHGAGTAETVADGLRGWLHWRRSAGWSLPSKMVIDTDREHERDPGIKAARLFALVGAEFGMSIKAIKRGEGR
jgi:hypothetical protein